LLKLHGVTYEYTNPSAFRELPGTHIGMVAQDVEQAFPSWVDTGDDGYKRVTFRGFEGVAVEAVRELDTNTKEAMARIADLERQNTDLRHSIEALCDTVRMLQQK
jgi:endosialidase-like protein